MRRLHASASSSGLPLFSLLSEAIRQQALHTDAPSSTLGVFLTACLEVGLSLENTSPLFLPLIRITDSQNHKFPCGLLGPPLRALTQLPSSLYLPPGAQNSVSWEVQRFDGWYNNLMEHRWGSKGEGTVQGPAWCSPAGSQGGKCGKRLSRLTESCQHLRL